MTRDVLTAMIRSKDHFFHSAISGAIRAIGKPALEPLAKALKHKDLNIRVSAAAVMLRMEDTRGKQTLVDLLAHRGLAEAAARTLRANSYRPESDSEWVHYELALGRRDELRRRAEIVKKVLAADIIAGERAEVDNAVAGLLGCFDREIVPDLVKLLRTENRKIIAEVYLESKKNELVEAAKKWAAAKGYKVVPDGRLVGGASDAGDNEK